jgi:hypothetical protein
MQDVRSEIIQLLGSGPRKARFVTELTRSVQRAGAEVSADAVEHELEELEAAGRVLVRAQQCADPHVVGSDLRIVGLIQPRIDAAAGEEQDPLARAIGDIEWTWQRWQTEYLASHRCG